METSAPLISAIVDNALTPTHASNRCRLKSFTSCAFCGRLGAPDFVMKCIEARAVRWPEVWKFYTGLLHCDIAGYITSSLQMSEDTIIVFISS